MFRMAFVIMPAVLLLCGSAFAGSAIYTGNSDPVHLPPGEITYGASDMTFTFGVDPNDYDLLETPSGTMGPLAPGDFTYDMMFVQPQTPVLTPGSYDAIGVEVSFRPVSEGVPWFGIYRIMDGSGIAIAVGRNGAPIPGTFTPIASDVHSLHIVRTGNTLDFLYSLDGSAYITLHTIDLGPSGENLATNTTIYMLARADVTGAGGDQIDVDEIRLTGPEIPDVNLVTMPVGGPIALGLAAVALALAGTQMTRRKGPR